MVVAPAGEFPDGAAAVGAGAALPRDPDAPWAIAGRKPGSYPTDLQYPWRRIRARAGLGEGLPMIGKLLGHPAPHRRWAPHPAPVSHGDGQTARRDPRRPARRSVAPRVCGPAHHGRARRGGRRASPRGRRADEPPLRSRAALLRIVRHYGERPEFVVLGGLVPELLCAGSAFQNAGTTDVDVQVDPEIACGAVVRELRVRIGGVARTAESPSCSCTTTLADRRLRPSWCRTASRTRSMRSQRHSTTCGPISRPRMRKSLGPMSNRYEPITPTSIPRPRRRTPCLRSGNSIGAFGVASIDGTDHARVRPSVHERRPCSVTAIGRPTDRQAQGMLVSTARRRLAISHPTHLWCPRSCARACRTVSRANDDKRRPGRCREKRMPNRHTRVNI